MKKIIKWAWISIGVLCAAGSYFVYWAFFDFERLPTGELLTEQTSPNGTYTVRAYVTNGGATPSLAVRGELVMHKQNDKTKNIYWANDEEFANMEWADDDTVIINEQTLHVPHDKYDFRTHVE